MDNLFSEFKDLDEQVRLIQIKKELKNESIQTHKIDGLESNPFVTKSTHKGINNFVTKTNHSLCITEYISTDLLVVMNQQILTALETGVSGLSFEFSKVLSVSDFEIIFENVLLEILILKFEINLSVLNQKAFFLNFQKYLKLKISDLANIIVLVNENSLEEVLFKEYVFLKKEIHQNNHASQSETLAEMLKKAEANRNKSPLSKTYFCVKSSKNFYLNIIVIKTLKILWQKVQEAYSVNNTLQPFVSMHISSSEQDINHQTIWACQIALAAMTGGADAILINKIEYQKLGFEAEFSNRITRNVQHILTTESFIDKVNDPSAGSYFINDLTNKLMSETWAIFSKD